MKKCKLNFLKDSKTSAKILLVLTDLVFLGLLIAIIMVPKTATWYSNIRHKRATMINILVSAFYPCVPFLAVTVLTLRKIAKNILDGKAFTEEMQKNIKKLGILILILAGFLLLAGYYYYLLFVVSFGAVFCSMIIKIFYDVFSTKVEKAPELPEDEAESNSEDEPTNLTDGETAAEDEKAEESAQEETEE